MHTATRSIFHRRNLGGAALLVLTLSLQPYCYAGGGNLVPDEQLLATMELRAQQSNPRDQAFLYADLADKMSLLLSKQMRDGDIQRAELTMQRMEHYSELIENDVKQNSKGLKKAEMLLHDTNRRLTDIARSVSGDLRPRVQESIKRLDNAQRSLLTQVFSK